MMQLKIAAPLLGFCAALLTVANSVFATDFQSPRTAALGGAGHGGPLLNDAIYMNPSYASFLPTYSFSGNYLWYKGGVENADGPSLHGHTLNFSIQDGRSEAFQAGVGYTQRENAKLLSIGASRAIIQQLGVGLGGKMIFPNASGQETARDLVFSTTFAASQTFQAVLVIDNLISSDTSKANGLYREFILGTKVNIDQIILIYFDPHLAPDVPGMSSFGHETGLEFPVMTDLFLRVGFFRNSEIPWQNARGRGYGFGFGWLAPRISLDYAFQKAQSPIGASAHTFGATVFF